MIGWIVLAVYLVGVVVATAGVIWYEDMDTDDFGEWGIAAFIGLFWPVVYVLFGIGKLGVWVASRFPGRRS